MDPPQQPALQDLSNLSILDSIQQYKMLSVLWKEKYKKENHARKIMI